MSNTSADAWFDRICAAYNLMDGDVWCGKYTIRMVTTEYTKEVSDIRKSCKFGSGSSKGDGGDCVPQPFHTFRRDWHDCE
ncbi:hypothetical protein FRC12_011881 [Ceratobasidium sp. 428]|nr:hypothetical protein FRC12_011881 [Ceratobasidium sp. 428]